MSHWKDFLDPEARGGRYLPWKEVARETGLSRTTAWRLQKRDDFPAPYAISPGRVGYREHEVEAWRISRGHRGARTSPLPDAPRAPAATAARPSDASSRRSGPAPGLVTPTLPGRADDHPPYAKPRKPGRPRSEHARAIAQQMLFDF